MRSLVPIPVLMTALVVGGCAGLRGPAGPEGVLTGGPWAQALALHPYTVVNYTRGSLTKDFESLGVFDNYYILQLGPYLSKDERVTLADLVSQAFTNPKLDKRCRFMPRHGVRFGGEGDSRGVLICFSCGTLVVCDRKHRWSADMGDQSRAIRDLLLPLLVEVPDEGPATR